MVRKVHTQLHSIFLFCSIIITQLLWISSKSELQFVCFIYTLALNFKDWTFSIIVTRYFRPKSGRLNKKVYSKPIVRTLKMIYIHGWVGQLSTTNYFWVMEVTGFSTKKKHKYNKTLKIFSKTKVSTISKKYWKLHFCTVLYICDKMYFIKATSRNLSI